MLYFSKFQLMLATDCSLVNVCPCSVCQRNVQDRVFRRLFYLADYGSGSAKDVWIWCNYKDLLSFVEVLLEEERWRWAEPEQELGLRWWCSRDLRWKCNGDGPTLKRCQAYPVLFGDYVVSC